MPSTTLYGKRVTFHIEEGKAQTLNEEAVRRRMRMSDLLREAIDDYLTKMNTDRHEADHVVRS